MSSLLLTKQKMRAVVDNLMMVFLITVLSNISIPKKNQLMSNREERTNNPKISDIYVSANTNKEHSIYMVKLTPKHRICIE